MNKHYITAKQVASDYGETLESMLERAVEDGVCPACCDEGCEVEPDGTCEHGNPSILLDQGLI